MDWPRSSVPQKDRRLAVAFNDYALVAAGMAGGDNYAYTFRQGCIAGQNAQLSGLGQWLEILAQISGPGSLIGEGGVGQFQPLDAVGGLGKGRDQFAAVVIAGIPSTVIAVQVGIDHQIYVLRSYAELGQATQQTALPFQADKAPFFFGQFVAVAGIDQDALSGRINEQAPLGKRQSISFVGFHDPLPESFGDQPEQSATIFPVDAVGDNVKINVTQSHGPAPQARDSWFRT